MDTLVRLIVHPKSHLTLRHNGPQDTLRDIAEQVQYERLTPNRLPLGIRTALLALLVLGLRQPSQCATVSPSDSVTSAVKGVVIINVTKSGTTDARFKDKREQWPKGVPSSTWVGAALTEGALKSVNDNVAAFAKKGTIDAEHDLLTCLTNLHPAEDPTRIISAAPDQIMLILLADVTDLQAPVAVVKETKRLTRLAQDIQTLATKVIQKELGKGTAADKEPTLQVMVQTITLSERRATVDISARGVPTPGENRTVADDSCKTGACVLRKATVTTGGTELCFLSIDVPITKVSDVKYDSTTGSLQLQSTPTTAFLGFDVAFDDILTKPEGFGWRNLVGKAFIKLSSRPADAFGFGIGFRPPRVSLGGLSLDVLQVFGAYVWTSQDSVTSAGAANPNSSYKGSIRGGLSFNLDKLADWLKL